MQVASLVTYFPLCSLFFKRGMDTLEKKQNSLRKRVYFLDRGLSTAPGLTAENPDCSSIKYFMFLTENEVYVDYKYRDS